MKNSKISLMRIILSILLFGFVGFFTSCNKDLPIAEPADIPALNPGATETIGEKLSEDPDYSLIWAIFEEDGISEDLLKKNTVFTVIAPNNDAIQQMADAITIPLLGFSLPLTPDLIKNIPNNPYFTLDDLKLLSRYMVIPGEQILLNSFPVNVPSRSYPTTLDITDLVPPQLAQMIPAPIHMLSTLSNRNGFWVNNIPISNPDQIFINGVIHNPMFVLTPNPGTTVKDSIFKNPEFSFFKAAVARADSGVIDPTKTLDFALSVPITNITVFVPDDDAFRNFLIPTIEAALIAKGLDPATALHTAQALASTSDVFSNPDLYPALTAEIVKGLVAYHILTVNSGNKSNKDDYLLSLRVFQNNLSPSDEFLSTLLNSSIPDHPGVKIKADYSENQISGITIQGMQQIFKGPDDDLTSVIDLNGNFSNNCLNGIFYHIDKVLIP